MFIFQYLNLTKDLKRIKETIGNTNQRKIEKLNEYKDKFFELQLE